MHLLRHAVLQRTVALLLVAGVGVACLPVASATTAVEAAFEHELRVALGDSEAVGLALDAARRAPTPEAAVEAFVEAYVSATGDLNAAHEILRLLQDNPNRFGAPALPLSHAVWTTTSSTHSLVLRSAPACLTSGTTPVPHQPVVTVSGSDPQTARSGLRALRTQQARAP